MSSLQGEEQPGEDYRSESGSSSTGTPWRPVTSARPRGWSVGSRVCTLGRTTSPEPSGGGGAGADRDRAELAPATCWTYVGSVGVARCSRFCVQGFRRQWFPSYWSSTWGERQMSVNFTCRPTIAAARLKLESEGL